MRLFLGQRLRVKIEFLLSVESVDKKNKSNSLIQYSTIFLLIKYFNNSKNIYVTVERKIHFRLIMLLLTLT